MGCFSWCFCDGKRSPSNRLKIGKPAYLLMPDGNHIYTDHYDGHGHFGSKDVYEVVLEQNREHLCVDMLEKPDRAEYVHEENYLRAYKTYSVFCEWLIAYQSGLSDEEMDAFTKYPDWKRELGIMIAHYDEQNKKLPFPIKISSKPVSYTSVPYSKRDVMQGCD